jgi:transducin (beta)-like 1
VHIWQVPDHPGDMPPPPVKVSYFTREDSADLTAMDWNVDGTLLAIGSYDAMLRIVSPNGSLYFSHPQHMVNNFPIVVPLLLILVVEKGPIFATRFSKSGRWLLTASLDGTACVWDIKDKKLFKQYRCHQGNFEFATLLFGTLWSVNRLLFRYRVAR